MPNQTIVDRGFLKIKDGCKVESSTDSGVTWRDLGETEGDVKMAVSWSEFIRQTGNAGVKKPIIRDMIIEGAFNLTDLSPDTFVDLSNGAITSVTTAASPDATINTHVIAANWTADTAIPIQVIDTETSVEYICTSITLASVTGSVSGAGIANDDYFVITDSNSKSGYSIVLKTTGTNTFATSETITIAFTTVTPVANTTLYCGTSTLELTPYSLRFTHVDSSSNTDFQVVLPVVYSKSGAFVLDFGGQGQDGVDMLPVQFRAQIDSTATDGHQLFSYLIK